MEVFNSNNESKKANNFYRNCALTIGNFDGYHLGHQKLITKVKEFIAEHSSTNIKSLILTFDPSPKSFFNPNSKFEHLFTINQKIAAFQEAGLDGAYFQEFKCNFNKLSHKDFYDSFLKTKFSPLFIAVGDNFKYGYKRQGDLHSLKEMAKMDNIALSIEPREYFNNAPISSSRIRETLKINGDVTDASQMLGRPYMIEGIIESGDQIGRKIDAPTANLSQVNQLIPLTGVYAGYVWLETEYEKTPTYTKLPKNLTPAVFNIGKRPTLNIKNDIRIEAHLLNKKFDKDSLYGLKAGYYLTHRLRDEIRFEDLSKLKTQIEKDIKHAKSVLNLKL